MPYGYKIELNGTDITAKVERFEITARLSSYCRELSLDIADPDLYETFDFTALPESPEIEVFTRIDSAFLSQGIFFAERPTFEVGIHSTTTGLWGRSITALLGPSFASKISKIWSEQTTFFAISAEMCAAAGIVWDPAYSDIADFVVFPNTFQAEMLYPIEVLNELAELAGAVISTDRLGHVCVRRRAYAPAVHDVEVTDAVTQRISEPPEWPDFGNRIKISASGSMSGYKLQCIAKNPCLPADGTSRAKIYARVTDHDGEPVKDIAVTWAVDLGIGVLDAPVTNTRAILISDEEQRAKNFHQVDVSFPPSLVRGIYAYRDTAQTDNLAAAGAAIEGSTITLTRRLDYCDQLLRITYDVEGVAVNQVRAQTVPGTETVTADVAGNSDQAEIYIDNPCHCSTTLRLTAAPSSINVGETALLLAYAEENGAPITMGRVVFMTEGSSPKRGILGWTSAQLQQFDAVNESVSAINEVAGVTQCELSMFPASVAAVYQSDEAGDPTGSNLLASFAGKSVNLNAALPTGTPLLVTYAAIGGAVNDFTGVVKGTATITAYLASNKEAPLEAAATITVNNPEQDPDDHEPPPPSDCCDETCHGEGAVAVCAPNQRCCEHKISGLKGCFPTDQCKPGSYPNKPDKDKDKKRDWDENRKKGGCKKSDGSVVVCKDNEACCSKMGVQDCYPKDSCGNEKPLPDTCNPKNCFNTPNPQACLTSRFTEALSLNPVNDVAPCSCTELCDKEISTWGASQATIIGGGRSIDETVTQEYGYQPGTPEYWEKYDEIKEQEMGSCLQQCGECANAEELTLSGPDAVTKPGGYQYSASGGLGAITWSVEGIGAIIDENGFVTLADNACGSYIVTAIDVCGHEATFDARITNSGRWVHVGGHPDCAFSPFPCYDCGQDQNGWLIVISGSQKLELFGCEQVGDDYQCSEWFPPVPSANGPYHQCGFETVFVYEWRCN